MTLKIALATMLLLSISEVGVVVVAAWAVLHSSNSQFTITKSAFWQPT